MAIIKKGSYKFIDNPTTLNNVAIDIPFTVQPVMTSYGCMTCSPLTRISLSTGCISLGCNGTNITLTFSRLGDISIVGLVPYQNAEWVNKYLDTSYNVKDMTSGGISVNGVFGRIITVTADTEVDDTSATWFNGNTEIISTATVTYNGKTIANIAGQTATIKCKGKVMKDDIVITL